MNKCFEKKVSYEDTPSLLVAKQLIEEGQEEPFVLINLENVRKQVRRWNENLPRVSPWYAIKCQPDEKIIKELFALGTGFDAASIQEMEMALSVGTPKEKIIFANPCKQPSHIRFAESVGIQLMTFDNIEELRKIQKYFPSAKLVMRILGDDSSSVCKFNSKFGVCVEDSIELIREARKIGANIVGVSFHVGSGCRSAEAFYGAISNARRAFDALSCYGFNPELLDLGGGWPGSLIGEEEPEEVPFETIAERVRTALDEFFPETPGSELKIIAEPGRYFAHSSALAVVNVIAKRAVKQPLVEAISGDDDTDYEECSTVGFRYYVNDGVYGTFNAVICDHRDNVAPSFFLNETGDMIHENDVIEYECSIWGNTCDSLDQISKSTMLPELSIGSWMVFRNMGAYTTSAKSAGFNGFPLTKKFYVC